MRLSVYILRRAILVLPVVVSVMTITFLLVSAIPVQQRMIATFGPAPLKNPDAYDPTVSCRQIGIDQNGSCANPTYALYAHKLGLDQPVIVQWGVYMWNTITLQWGWVNNHSIAATNQPEIQGHTVITVIGWYLPYTIELGFLSLALILLITFPLGRIAAVQRNRTSDHVIRAFSFSGFAIPSYLVGSLLLFFTILSIEPNYGFRDPFCHSQSTFLMLYGSWPSRACFPGGTYPAWLQNGVTSTPTGFPTIDAALHHQYFLAFDTVLRMLLPALVIAIGSVAGLLRFVRNSMLEVLNQDYVRTARATGLPESSVIKKHAGRNSMNVVVTVLGLTFAGFLGGFPIVESVFGVNGVGRMFAQSVVNPIDFGLLFGTTLLFTYIVVAANLIVDVIYSILDPRVRLG